MIKRPDCSETDEDLLRLQEEYLTRQQKPSVSVKKISNKTKLTTQRKLDKDDLNNGKVNGEQFYLDLDDLQNAWQRLDEKENCHTSSILSDIKEKDVSNIKQFLPKHNKKGFPTALFLDKRISKGKKKSLFAQQFSRNNCSLFGEVGGNSVSNITGKSNEVDLTSSVECTDSPLKKSCDIKYDIEEENNQILREMKEEEILEQQKNLLSTLDPKVVKFLQMKKVIAPLSKSEKPDEITHGCHVDCCDEMVVDPKDDKSRIEIDPHIDFGIRKGYVNMNVVEKEKLEWMKKLPNVSTKKEQKTPRFDFEGKLLLPGDDTATNKGLHHHGDEPDVAGYSLKELFHMIRSNFPQQRVFGLEMLAKIIEKYHQHEFVGKLSADLLIQCLDAGLVFILRWSLDEQSEQIYSAALLCLSRLTYVIRDQELVDKLFYTEGGLRVPSLCTFYKKKKEKMTQEEQEEDRDLTDAELLERDVVQGLLQMQILPRLRYLLSFTSRDACKNCLAILIRVTQHSSQCAYQVLKYPGLMTAVMKVFTDGNQECEMYALKLLKCLCLSDRQICNELILSYSMVEVIIKTISSTKLSGAMERFDTDRYIMVCQLWSVLLEYGAACNLVRDLHSVLMQQLQKISADYSLLNDVAMASLIILVHQIFKVARQKEKIDWSIVNGFFPVLQFALKKVRNDLFDSNKVSYPLYLSSLIRCYQQYFTSRNEMVNASSKLRLFEDIEMFWNENIEPLLLSELLSKLLYDGRCHSDFSQSYSTSTNSKISNMPMYGSHVLSGGLLPPSLADNSPLFFIQALFNSILQLSKIAKQLIPKLSGLLISPELLAYLKCFLESQRQKRSVVGVWRRVEVLLTYFMSMIFYQVGTFCGFQHFQVDVANIFLDVASHLVCLFHIDDRALAAEIMECIIFNEKIFRRQEPVVSLPTAYDREKANNFPILLEEARKNLFVTGEMYLQILFGKEKRKASAETDMLLSSPMQNTAVPSDWMFLPMVQLYNHSLELELAGRIISKASDEAIGILKSCLHFVILLEATKPSLLDGVNEILRLTRFVCVFLTEGNLYKEEVLEESLETLVAIYSSSPFICYLNLEDKIPGVSSFYDLYSTLLGEYVASSFADPTFANVLLIPMQLNFHVQYRRSVWTEHFEILQVFPISLKKITCDIKRLLAAEHEDEQMIKLYFRSLYTSSVGTRCCPLFYLIAVHHVSQFIFKKSRDAGEDGEKESNRKIMLNQIVTMKDTTIRDDIIYYKSFDVEHDTAVVRFQHLPPSREIWLRNRMEHEIRS